MYLAPYLKLYIFIICNKLNQLQLDIICYYNIASLEAEVNQPLFCDLRDKELEIENKYVAS